jgi:WD40 repeat protein
VREEPGALPLLQYALTEVFERREGRNLTLDAYSASGGALGALARRAEELYSTMDSARQAATRQLFLRLVTLGEGAEDTRRRVSWNELLALSSDGHIPDAMQDVLDSFGKYRLLSFDRDPQTRAPTVEVGHEALIREWTRLREWLDESRESVRLERQLASAAAEWENAKRDPSFLLHGTRLAQFEEWAGETDLALTRAERDYLQASVAERKRQEAAEAERRAHEAALEQQSRNRLRTLVGVMTVAAVIGLALAGLAFNQSVVAQNNAATATIAQGLAVIEAGNAQTQAAIVQVERDKADAARSTSDANAALAATNAAAAQTQAAIAERNANEAQGLALAAGSQQALSAGNTDLALALAVEATKLDQPPPQAQHALIAAAYAPGTERLLRGHTGRVFDAVFSADQQWVLSIGGDGNLLLWNITSGKEAYRATLGDDQLDQLHGSISLNADGSEALITLSSGKLILWDVPSWKEIRRFNTDIGIWKAVFLPGSHTALVSYNLNSSNLRLIDLDSGQVVRNFGASGDGHKSGVPAIAISPDGRYALSGSGDDTLILWDIASGTAVRTYAGHTGTVSAVAFSPDGNTFASAAADGGGIVWNTQTGEQLHTFIYKGGGFESAAFSPDGRTILTGATGGMLLLWDAQTANLLRHYVGHDSDVNSAVFSADGRTILSASSDTTLRLWSVNSGAELRQIEINNKVRSLAVSPDQKTMLVGASDGNLGLWNFVDEKKVRDFPKQGDSILAIQYAPDGRTAISTSYDGNVAFWDVASGVELHRYHQDNATASDVVLTPDKQSAVASVFSFSGYLSGTDFVVLDIASGQEIRKFRIDGTVSSFAFSPDGQTILVGLLTGSVEPTGGLLSLDFSSGKTLHQFEYPSTSPVYSVAISPDGKWGLAGSGDANVTLWDMATGKEIRRFVGHSDEVHSVAFSMDGNLALSTSQDASVILWDVSTGQEIVRFTGHTDRVHAVFSPDGKTIFSGSSDGSLRQWRVPPSLDQLLDWTRRTRYIADLTCDQRAFYRVQPLCAASGALPTATP